MEVDIAIIIVAAAASGRVSRLALA